MSLNMKVKIMKIKEIERILDYALESYTLEEFLEFFDITPLDAIILLYDSGMINPVVLKELAPTDGYDGY